MVINKEVIFIGGFVIALALLNKKIESNNRYAKNFTGGYYKNASGKILKSGAQKTYPIASISLCCIWGCQKCKFKWGGKAQGWIKK